MRVCPTEAIRVRNRVATINETRCIDCGKCVSVCTTGARTGVTDTVAIVQNMQFKYKIALPSPVLYSQFGKDTLPNDILNALVRVGFDEAYDVAYICELYNQLIKYYLSQRPHAELTLSSMCPVVVRLIQFKFPHLLPLLFPMESGRGLAAMHVKKQRARELGLREEEIQATYITPCPAKMIAINQPQCKQKSYLDAAISLADIYGPLLKALGSKDAAEKNLHRSGGIGISFSMIGGEIRGLDPETSLAVDGIFNVIEVLEDIEDEKLKGIQYLELRACTGGCIGGLFTVENQYLARNKVVRLIRKLGKESRVSPEDLEQFLESESFYCDIRLQSNSIDMLDRDPQTALQKIKEREDLLRILPGIDCGACGAPSCKSFAEDVVLQQATIDECLVRKARALAS
mgnify:FL=1